MPERKAAAEKAPKPAAEEMIAVTFGDGTSWVLPGTGWETREVNRLDGPVVIVRRDQDVVAAFMRDVLCVRKVSEGDLEELGAAFEAKRAASREPERARGRSREVTSEYRARSEQVQAAPGPSPHSPEAIVAGDGR